MDKYAVITVDGFGDFELAKPTFDVYAVAIRKLIAKDEPDMVNAGKAIFDACYLGNNGTLAEIQKDTMLYTSLCFKAAEDLQIYQSELKKN